MQNPIAAHHPSGYRPDIDGLRAVAVLGVVIYHAFPTALRGGFVGVDVFFVISGYLISGIIFQQTRAGRFSLAAFYANRVRRIFPALLAVLVACGVAGWYLLLPQEYQRLGKHIAAGAGFVQNIVLQREAGYFDIASELKPLLHLWSLAIEEQFYLAYPLLMLLAWRAGQRIRGTLLFLTLLSFALNLYGVRHDLVTTFFWPHTRVWELLAGALLAYAQVFDAQRFPAALRRLALHPARVRQAPTPVRQQVLLSNAIAWLGLTLIAFAALWLSPARFFPGAWALLPVLGAAGLILAGPRAWVNARLLASRPMVAIGLISYPLYLWHWPLLSFAAIIENGATAPALRAAAVLLALTLAWLTYRCLERPLRYGTRKTLALWGLLGSMAIVGTLGYTIHAREGIEQRFPLLASQAAYYDKWTWGSNPACTARYPQLQGVPYCLLGPDTPPEVALIGDSHANQYYPGLVEQGLKVINLGKGSCLPFLDATTHSPLPRPQGEICPPEHINRAIAFALAEPSIRHIALSGRFQQYHDAASEAKIFTGPPAARMTGNPQVFRATLDHTLARLVASGKHIVFILDNPDPLFDPKTCIRLPLLRSHGPLKTPCATDRQSIEQRHSGYRAAVFEVLKKYPTVQVFDPFGILCDRSYCWAAQGSAILYRDTDHLSLQGSRHVAAALAALFRQKE